MEGCEFGADAIAVGVGEGTGLLLDGVRGFFWLGEEGGGSAYEGFWGWGGVGG